MLSECLIVVFDSNTSEQLLIKFVQQINQIGPCFIAIMSVLFDVRYLIVDRFLQQHVTFSQVNQFAFKIFYLVSLVLVQSSYVICALLIFLILILSSFVSYVCKSFQVGNIINTASQIEQGLFISLSYFASFVAPVELHLTYIFFQFTILVFQRFDTVQVSGHAFVQFVQFILFQM